MITNRNIVDRFLRNPASQPKTYRDAYTELLKQINGKPVTGSVVPKSTPLNNSNQGFPNSGTQSFNDGGTIDFNEASQAPLQKKKLSPFLIIGTIVAIIVIAVVYRHNTNKMKERDQAKKETEEKTNKQKAHSKLDDILNSSTLSAGKKVLTLIVIIFGAVAILYAFTLVIKQMRNMEEAAFG